MFYIYLKNNLDIKKLEITTFFLPKKFFLEIYDYHYSQSIKTHLLFKNYKHYMLIKPSWGNREQSFFEINEMLLNIHCIFYITYIQIQ